MLIVSNELHPIKQQVPNLLTEEGNSICVKLVQFWNASASISSHLLPKTTSVKDEQPENVPQLTLQFISTFLRPELENELLS